MKVFSIYDLKAKAYLQPIFMANRAVAIRSLQVLLKEKDNQFVHSPADFQLFELGDYDAITGVITSLPKPDLVGSIVDYMPVSA